jgi:IMP dehydrogenase
MNNFNDFPQALTFDDVLLSPCYSEILPEQASLVTKLTRNLSLKIPLLSAAMDTVTEARTAITIAQQGGVGVLHKNMSIEEQADNVCLVKKSETVIISDPVTINKDSSVKVACELMDKHNISGLPVVHNKYLVGILTGRDVRFEKNLGKKVEEVMTADVISVEKGISLEKSNEIMHQHRIEKLPVVNSKDNTLLGMYTIKDIEKAKKHPYAAKDDNGRLLVGGAVGVGGESIERAHALLDANCNIIVVDTAHGHSLSVLNTIKEVRKNFSSRYDFSIIGGNVATEAGAAALVEAGVDAVKVGIGPGSICTTRIIAGIGVPQLSAIFNCAKATCKHSVPIIADGGIRFSGDIVKALAAGADSVMIGSLFAGTDESPGEIIIYQGKSYKKYRGMGSIGAMKQGSKDRYFQTGVKNNNKLVPEGVEGRLPHKGPLADVLFQLVGGIKAAMGYLGASSLEQMRNNANFVRITPASLKESHTHDVHITHGSPNYQID